MKRQRRLDGIEPVSNKVLEAAVMQAVKEWGRQGGSRNSPAQQAARKKNIRKALKARGIKMNKA